MSAYAASSFLIGNFSAIPYQNSSQYINSTNPVDRAAVLGLVPWPVFYNWVISLEREWQQRSFSVMAVKAVEEILSALRVLSKTRDTQDHDSKMVCSLSSHHLQAEEPERP